jgi:glycosyltransferase involved in cell wall biosynthesis
MMDHRLSIIISCFNEEQHLPALLKQLSTQSLDFNCSKEMIIVDDASSDNTGEILNAFVQQHPELNIKTIRHEKNRGKGACIRSALEHATGDILVIQDADLEYHPNEYNRMLRPIIEGYADVVYGSRFRGSDPHRVLFFFHTMGNKFLTFLSNLFTQLNLSDMETGYKMFRTKILRQITLKENRFGFEPEVTAKISRIKNIKIYEVGISYYGRGFEEGKKIRWYDGFRAIYCILKYNIFSRK